MRKTTLLGKLPILAVALAFSSAGHADGDIRCDAGPQATWQPIAEVKKRAWQEGWTVQKAKIQNDCYEVYARTETGQAIEAFFHPVTLQKLVVFRRGREIFRAPGFSAR